MKNFAESIYFLYGRLGQLIRLLSMGRILAYFTHSLIISYSYVRRILSIKISRFFQ